MIRLPPGKSYLKRVEVVNEIYDRYKSDGITNDQIYRRYVYPKFAISIRTFYYYLKREYLVKK